MNHCSRRLVLNNANKRGGVEGKQFKRDTRVSSLFVQKWCFSCLELDFSKYFQQVSFFLVLTSRTCFGLNDF